MLFDTVTKTLKTNNEQNLALGEQAFRAIDLQNQQFDKQTEMIEQTRNKALMMSNEALGKPDGEAWTKSNEAVEETRDIAPVYVDRNTTKILHLMGAQTNPQLKLDLVDLPSRSYKKNKGHITLEQGAFLVNDNIYVLSEGFINFLTNPNVTYGDIDEDENKIKRFLFDVGFDIGKSEKRSSRYRTIKRILEDKKLWQGFNKR